MARTFLRQDTQVRNSDAYDDTIAPTLAAYETNPTELQTDLNNIRSQLQNFLNRNGASFPAGDWYADVVAPSTFEGGSKRGINELGQQLHDLERKRVLVSASILGDATVGAGNNFFILTAGTLPSNTTAAVGAVTTRGTVVAAHGGTFGTHSLAEIGGSNAIAPKNFVEVFDGATRDPILSSGRVIYGLLQGESGLTDGVTITAVTTTRAQVSFVRINAAGDDLEAVPFADIENRVVNFAFVERKAMEDLTEQDFLRGAVADVPSSATVTRQVAYDNQGATAVDLTTAATLDLEGAGLVWRIRDDLEADLFRIVEGSAGGTSRVHLGTDVDFFDVDAVDNDFLNGIKVDTGAAGTTINVGVTANQIDAGGALRVASGGAADLSLAAALELNLTDSYRAGSTWSLADGIALANSSAEWSAFETAFGEVSLLSAITQAKTTADFQKTCANVTANTAANNDVGGVAGGTNLDAQIHSLAGGDFLTDHDVYLNGQLLRGGINAGANHDYYPGASLANGQLRFEFTVKNNDVLCAISRG